MQVLRIIDRVKQASLGAEPFCVDSNRAFGMSGVTVEQCIQYRLG